jgi:hypothetical protein
MRMQFVYAAVFLAIAAPAAAQTSQPTCNRPASSRPAPSPQVVAAHRAANQACAADMAMFCAGVAPGCGRPQQCLSAHSAQLSGACTTARLNLRAMTHPMPN